MYTVLSVHVMRWSRDKHTTSVHYPSLFSFHLYWAQCKNLYLWKMFRVIRVERGELGIKKSVKQTLYRWLEQISLRKSHLQYKGRRKNIGFYPTFILYMTELLPWQQGLLVSFRLLCYYSYDCSKGSPRFPVNVLNSKQMQASLEESGFRILKNQKLYKDSSSIDTLDTSVIFG